MPLPRRHLVPATLAFVALAMAAPAWVGAQGQSQEPAPQAGPRAVESRPSEHRALSDAVRRVERATNGQVLSAERVQFDGRDVNRVKIIDGRGRVRVYWDDPQATRAEREAHRIDRAERAERDPARPEEPPRRTRRDDGPAFNL